MIGKYIRLILATLVTLASVFLFINGSIGGGIWLIILALFLVLFHFKNEINLLAFLLIRFNKFDKAEAVLSRVKHPERMLKSQEAFYHFLIGVSHGQLNQLSRAEQNMKKALSLGLRMKSDQAMAKLSLASYYMAKRKKNLAIKFINDAKKLDERKMLSEQIKELESMIRRV